MYINDIVFFNKKNMYKNKWFEIEEKKKKTSGRFSHGTDQPDNLSLDGLGPKPD